MEEKDTIFTRKIIIGEQESEDPLLNNKDLADEITKLFSDQRKKEYEHSMNFIAVQDSINPEIIKLIGTQCSKPSYEISKIGFLVGGKLMVFRRVSNLRLEGDEYKFETQIKKFNTWKTVPVTLIGKKVFEQGI